MFFGGICIHKRGYSIIFHYGPPPVLLPNVCTFFNLDVYIKLPIYIYMMIYLWILKKKVEKSLEKKIGSRKLYCVCLQVKSDQAGYPTSYMRLCGPLVVAAHYFSLKEVNQWRLNLNFKLGWCLRFNRKLSFGGVFQKAGYVTYLGKLTPQLTPSVVATLPVGCCNIVNQLTG